MGEAEGSDARWKILIEADKDSSTQRLAKNLLGSLARLYKCSMEADVDASMGIIEENLGNYDKIIYKRKLRSVGKPRYCWGAMARDTLEALRQRRRRAAR